MSLPWAGYMRVSRVGDRGDRLLSPEQQAEQIQLWASSRGVDVEFLPPELDESGGKLNRPILQRAISGVEEGRYAGLVVAYTSRLSRRLTHILAIFDRVEKAGGQIVAVADNIDTSTRAGRLQRNTIAMFAEFEHDGYREHIERAKRSAVDRGIWPTSRVPFGYRKAENRKLVVEPSEAEVVRRAFAARAAGEGWGVVGDILGRGPSGAQKTIRNRVYLGEVAIDGIGVTAGAHPAIVDRAVFEAAQIRQPRPARSADGPKRALLAGLVRCAGCQRLMTPNVDTGGGLNYRCKPRNALGRCAAPAIVARHLADDYVERAALSQLRALTVTLGQATSQIDAAAALADDAEAELGAYLEAVKVTDVGAQAYRAGMDVRRNAVEQARRGLARAKLAAGPAPDAAQLVAHWGSLTVEERGHVLRGLLGVVWVRKGRGVPVEDRCRIVLAGQEPADLPRAGPRAYAVEPVPWPDSDFPGEIRPAGAQHVE